MGEGRKNVSVRLIEGKAPVMASCRGCGRRIESCGHGPAGNFLCSSCHHQQEAKGREKGGLGHLGFKALVLSGILAVGFSGMSLCVLYLLGTGRAGWFALLLTFELLVLVCPLIVFRHLRHVALLAAALYCPLGVWCLLWSVAPGVKWEYSGATRWGGIMFIALGLLGLYIYLRDLKRLPRW